MNFSCTQENLYRGLSIVSHVASKSVHLPILHNVLIEAKEDGVDMVATNLEIGIRVHLRGKVQEPGAFTVPAVVLTNYIGLLSEERIDISQKDLNLVIHAGNQDAKIRGEAAVDFPLIPDVERTQPLTLPIKEFIDVLKQVVIAASHDESRPELTGVLFRIREKQLIIAATDSYRLVERRIPLPQPHTEQQMIIPAQTLHELIRILSENTEQVTLYFHESQVLFTTPVFEMTSRLIEGLFPDYEQIIPTQQRTTVQVDRQACIQAIKAASLFSKSGIHDINFHFSPEKQQMTLTTVNNQVGENVTRVPIEIQGESNNTVLNYRYLLDALTHLPTSTVRMSVIDNMTPVVFQPHGDVDVSDTYVHIVMPIRQ